MLYEPGAMRAGLAWYRACDFLGQHADRIRVPTLFVWGTGDPALGRDGTKWTAGCLDTPYRFVVEDGPRWLPETHPEELNRLLHDHLEADRENGKDER